MLLRPGQSGSKEKNLANKTIPYPFTTLLVLQKIISVNLGGWAVQNLLDVRLFLTDCVLQQLAWLRLTLMVLGTMNWRKRE